MRKKKYKFIAASKLIGIAVIGGMIATVGYSMTMIYKIAEDAISAGITPDMSPLNTLIGGIFTVSAAYIGFYINMAKSEHIEDKKNEIRLQIKEIEKDGITPDEEQKLSELYNELQALNSKFMELNGSENMGGYNG